MGYKWIKTNFPGVRYREHATRKHGVSSDRYFSVYYRLNGKQKEEGIGWASDGWTAKKSSIVLNDLKKNHLTGEGPQTLSEKRELKNKKREDEKREQERIEQESITFNDFFENSYCPVAKSKKTGVKKEREHVKNWLSPVVGGRPLKQIKPLHLERVKRNMLDAGRTPRSVQYVLATFRQVWNMARRDGLVSEESPSKQLKRLKINNRRLRFLTHDEAEMLLDSIRERDVQLYNMSLISLHTGMRAGELFNLTWGCIDLYRGLIHILDPKSERDRTAYMTEGVKRVLSEIEPGKPNHLVFADNKGRKFREIPSTFRTIVKKLELNSGIADGKQKIVFHSLRHTFASWLVENGTDLYHVKELMGHSTLAMTERYSHLGKKTLQNAINNLQDKMNSKNNVVELKRKNGSS